MPIAPACSSIFVLYCHLRLFSSSSGVISVPVEAIVEEMGLYFVYVQLNPELFEKREVTLGGTDGRRTQVLQGLQAGERVVASGAVLVKLTQASGGVDPHAGHSH